MSSIVAADMNNDGVVDIMIGNDGDADQVLVMAAFMMHWNLYCDDFSCK
jgi:hypothetical protein